MPGIEFNTLPPTLGSAIDPANDFLVINDVSQAAALQDSTITFDEAMIALQDSLNLTTGRIPFVDASGHLIDDADLAWDNVNKKMTLTGAIGPQLDIIFNGLNKTSFEVDSLGNLIITPSGSFVDFTTRIEQNIGNSGNTFFGNNAGSADAGAAGNRNAVFGEDAYDVSVTGIQNAVFGRGAAGNANGKSFMTAIGYNTLSGGAAGDGNTGVGRQSLQLVNGGEFNSALGANSGDNISTADYCVIIGADVDAQSSTLDNQMNYQNYIFGDGMDGRGSSVSAGRIGFGVVPTGNMAGITVEDGVIILKEITTPSTVTGYGIIYTKADNKLYVKTGDGIEHEIAFV